MSEMQNPLQQQHPLYYQPPQYPYPSDPSAQQRAKYHGLAIAGFVCSLVGCIFGLIPLTFVFAFILAALGITFSAIGRKHGLGKAGLVLGIIAAVLGIVGAVIVNSAVNNLNDSFNCIDNATTVSEMNDC